ncbi:MAG: L-fuconolactonase [Paracoccaceae bacterium]|jgi:L-fuconolactonase
MQIDAHQHYWDPRRGDYDWMSMDSAILARPYHPVDLQPELAAHGIAKTVLVQAAATVQETEYMLGIADATDSVAGVVGWIDFERPQDRSHLERWAKHPKFFGVRPMIQDIPAVDWMLRDDVQWGFQAVCDLGLSFDALGFPRHLMNFHKILTRYPAMRVVIDHCMKPQIRDQNPEDFQEWADGMHRLAQDTSAYCKLSGLVTEANDNWTTDDLRPYSDHLFAVFGAKRLMWGSDWPVCQLQASYGQWRATAEALTNGLSSQDKDLIFGDTAAKFYKIPGAI